MENWGSIHCANIFDMYPFLQTHPGPYIRAAQPQELAHFEFAMVVMSQQQAPLPMRPIRPAAV